MNKKSLSLGMILPMVAAGAVATAPTASANSPERHGDHSSVRCDLKAWADGHGINVKLEVDSKGHQGKEFRVWIYQNRDRIVRRTVWDRDGDFTLAKKTVNERGTDYFLAYVRNIKTGDYDTCQVKVEPHR